MQPPELLAVASLAAILIFISELSSRPAIKEVLSTDSELE